MAEAREGIFRKQALERMTSPERLDQLIQIVTPKDWLLLGTFLTLGVILLAWCIWGKVPTTVDGQGMIVRPRKVVELQSQSGGKLVNFSLHVGDEIKPGEVLGVIDQAEIRKQVEEDTGLHRRVALVHEHRTPPEQIPVSFQRQVDGGVEQRMARADEGGQWLALRRHKCFLEGDPLVAR